MPHPSDPNDNLVISYLSLRKAIGILGIVLPVLMVLGVFVLTDCNVIQPSISDYFYTKMGYGFVATLCSVALFLFCYKGYNRTDQIASKLACFFALGVAFFPTYGPDPAKVCNFIKRNSDLTISTVHDISAASFFFTLAFFSLFLFTKTSGDVTPEKIKRNRIYRICGYIMLFCVVSIFVYLIIPSIRIRFSNYKPVFAFETLALWAFGFSWLTKGEFILRDK